MVRVHTQRAASAGPAAARHKATLGARKPSYRVVLEQVTQEKKKLITVVSFEAAAPPGYTFIPAGDPQLTTRCKQLSRDDGVRVLIVSTTPHKHKKDLSQQVHRIGYHFPSYIVDKACMSLGVQLSHSGQVIRRQQVMLAEPRKRSTLKKTRKLRGDRNSSPKSDISQATLDTQAREAIRDLFPKIPERDLHAIVARAFQKGKDRVGTAAELSLPRRVQLAVVAHIRHVYTDYDKLLKTGSWLEARARIERACLDQLAQWRGDDDDDDPNAMEDILREVIVIPDDDEEDVDGHLGFDRNSLADRQQSVEIVSSHALAHEVQTRPIEYGHSARDGGLDRPPSPESEQETGIQYLGPAQYILDSREYQGEDRRGHHRHRAWEEALDRRRKNPNVSHDMDHRIPLQAPPATIRTPQSGYDNMDSFWRPVAPVQPTLSAHRPQQAKPEVPVYIGESPPRPASLQSFELADSGKRPQAEGVITMKQIPTSQQKHSFVHHDPRYVLVNNEQPEFADQRNQRSVHKEIGRPRISMQEPAELRLERVLPSIESNPRTHLSVQTTDQRERGRLYPTLGQRVPENPSERTFRVIDFDQGTDIQQMKRRRVDDQELWGLGRNVSNTSHSRVLIPIGQSEAPRYEEPPVKLAADSRSTVSYIQQPKFLQPLGAANGFGQRPYLQSSQKARYEPVAENRLDHPRAFQSPPSHAPFRRSLVEAQAPFGRPLSYSLSDHARAHTLHELSQSALSNSRELYFSHHGASTPYVSSRRHEITPLDSPDHDIRGEPAGYEQVVMERDYPRRVHGSPVEVAEDHVQHNLYDETRLEERGQIVYIPVQQDQSTPQVEYRPRAKLPLERSYQGLQPLTVVSQPRYQDSILSAKQDYRRVTHSNQAVRVESRPYPMYKDGHVEVLQSAAPRAGDKQVRLEVAAQTGQGTGTPRQRQHWDGRYSSGAPMQTIERARSRGEMGAAQHESKGRDQFMRGAAREIIVIE